MEYYIHCWKPESPAMTCGRGNIKLKVDLMTQYEVNDSEDVIKYTIEMLVEAVSDYIYKNADKFQTTKTVFEELEFGSFEYFDKGVRIKATFNSEELP